MKVLFVETERDGFVQVAYIERLHVYGNTVLLELPGGRMSALVVSTHDSEDDARSALKRLINRVGFGQFLRRG